MALRHHRAISHQQVTAKGTLRFEGQDIIDMAAPAIASLGIAHVPEGRGTFGDLTVLENLRVGAIHRRDKDGIEQDIARMQTLFPKLSSRAKQAAGTLSGGEQQMLAIARILRTGARVLLLDEPTEGLAPVIVDELVKILRKVKDDGLPVLLVEQNLMVCDKLADRHYVLEQGRVVYEGSAEAFRADPTIKNRYLALSA